MVCKVFVHTVHIVTVGSCRRLSPYEIIEPYDASLRLGGPADEQDIRRDQGTSPAPSTGCVVAAVSTLLGASISAIFTYYAAAKPDDGPGPQPSPIVTISNPGPGEQVPWCPTVRGSATIREDQALVVADLERTMTTPASSHPSYAKQMGMGGMLPSSSAKKRAKSSIGYNYTIFVLVMDKGLVDYLRNVRGGKTWWSSSTMKNMNTLVSKKIEVPVTRSGKPGDC